MKITMNLSEVPSSYTFKADGLVQLTDKATNMGLYSVAAHNIKITSRLTGEQISIAKNATPLKVKLINELDGIVPKHMADATLVGILYQCKTGLNATKGNNKDSYIVTYEV